MSKIATRAIIVISPWAAGVCARASSPGVPTRIRKDDPHILHLRVNHNTAQPGVRFSLDSDKSQQPQSACCGYINAQVSPAATGVWCAEDSGAGQTGDGYSRSWSSPGTDGSTGNEPSDAPGPEECLPTQ